MAANIRKSGSDFFIEIDGIAIRCTLEDIKVLSKKCTYVCLEHGLFSQHDPAPGTGRPRNHLVDVDGTRVVVPCENINFMR